MRRYLLIAAGLLALLSPAKAADSTVSAMTAASALSGTELLYCVQSAADRKCTPVQLSAYIFGTVSGDLTCTGLGACTLKNTGPGATGPLGSTTTAPVVTIDAQGRVTALTSATIALPTAANPSATAGPTAVNGVATTFMRSDGAPAVQQGSASQKGIVQVDGTTITATAGVISAVGGSGTVTSIATSCGVTGGTITGTGTISSIATSAVQTGTNYAFLTADCGTIVYLNNASPQIPTIAQAGTTGFAAGWYVEACNIGGGTQTITPATSTIGGASTYVLAAGSAAAPKCIGINSDGTNYKLDLTGPYGPFGTAAAANTGTSGGTLPFLNGTNAWSGQQTFSTVLGTVTIQSGTTYTLNNTDCGTLIRFTNVGSVTVTIPQGLTVGCNIAIMQAAAGQVSVNGSAVTPATLQSAHSYTKTFGAGAIIGISSDATNHATLTGDGA